MMTAEQLIATQKANLDTLFSITSKMFEGVEKVVELNLQAARTSMGETADVAKSALSVKDAQEMMAFQASLLQPAAEKAAAYSRHLYEIATSTSAELKRLSEATTADAQSRFLTAVDTATKSAPAGTENVVALMKSSVAAANNAFEGVQKAVKQASDVAEANFQTMSANATKVVESVSKPRVG